MLMKVFNKGQVVIPSYIRHLLGIRIGSMVDIEVDLPRKTLKLKKPSHLKSETLAGSLSAYREKSRAPFPSRQEMHEIFAEGLME